MKWWQPSVPRIALAILGVASMTGVSQAQNYFQDFSATFPPPEEAGKVTVVIEDSSGAAIVPFVEYPVPGLTPYAGRHQFAARTGGANANQEVSGVVSTYTSGGADTMVTYLAEDAETGGNGAYEPDLGFLTDDFWTLSENGIGNIQSAVAWEVAHTDPYDTASHNFRFKIDGFEDPANDQADGLGWAYLNVDNHGDAGVIGPGISEEPGFAGSLGVGFDIWNNGGEGGNSVSLHHDGRLLGNVPIDAGTTDPNTGEDWAFNSFERDDIDNEFNVTVIVEPGSGDVTAPELKGGSPYQTWNRSGAASELVQVGGGDSMEGYFRVVPEAGGAQNYIAFDWDGNETSESVVATFNFRGLNENGNRADGLGFMLLPVSDYDTEGAEGLIDGWNPAEDPNLLGALGFGFDTYQNGGDSPQCDDCVGDQANEFSVHFDGIQEDAIQLPLEEIDLVTNDPDVWHTAEITIEGDDVKVVVIDGLDGSEHTTFEGTIPGVSGMGAVRPAFAARTGGAFDHYEIDNFSFTGACSGGTGDYNNDGVLDALDIDLQAAEMKKPAAEQDLARFDHNCDGVVDLGAAGPDESGWGDRLIWIRTLRGTSVGDVNFDNVFDSGDLVLALQGTKYGNGQMAGWIEGDWNGDMVFDSGDLVLAFQDGQYVAAASPAAVPEPSAIVLLLLGTILLVKGRRR